MKRRGATAHEVYRKARQDGFWKHECLLLIMGVFDLELSDAREIGHHVYFQDQGRSGASKRQQSANSEPPDFSGRFDVI